MKTLEIKHKIEGKIKGAYTYYMVSETRRRSPKSSENSGSPFFHSTHAREEERKTQRRRQREPRGFTHHRRRWRLRGGVGQRRERRTDCERRWKFLELMGGVCAVKMTMIMKGRREIDFKKSLEKMTAFAPKKSFVLHLNPFS